MLLAMTRAQPETAGSTVAVIGLGKIGLPLAAQFAGKGMNVIGCDINPDVVATVNSGQSHIREEPGWSRLLRRPSRAAY